MTATGDTRTEPSAVWLRVFAHIYDSLLWSGEISGMRRRRHALLTAAHGRVLEIGAGTGLNIAHYPADIAELVLAEPEPGMRKRLAHRLQRHGRSAQIIDAPAERLSAPDASVDTVVSTLVLCTVNDPDAALREIVRVLRPGGQLLFIEHVRASSRWRAALQDATRTPWRHFAGGCICNRETLKLMRACGFDVEADDAVWRTMPGIVRPLTVGRATP